MATNVYIQPIVNSVYLDTTTNTVVVSSPGPQGAAGPSAYQMAVTNGYIGTEAQWLAQHVLSSTSILTVEGIQGGGDLMTSRTLSLTNTGVVPGTYAKVSVDSKGRITGTSSLLDSDIPTISWSKISTSTLPNTLSGYGITDAINLTTYTTDKALVYSTIATKADPDVTFQFTRSLILSTDWQDVNINNTSLTTGTYIVQLYANDISSGGTNNNEYYSGVMSWYAGATNSSLEMPTDEVPLHRAGGGGDGSLYLRTYRSGLGTTNLKLQIYSNTSSTSSANYVFKFRKMI